jgi:phytoene synthase
VSDALLAQSHDVLRTRARSFRWGQAFLAPDQADDAAIVYALCRLVDDTADEADDDEIARRDMTALQRELRAQAPARPIVSAYLAVAQRCGIHEAAAHHLCDGCMADLDTVRVANDEELIQYSYRVAGTVGLMMCGVLGVDDARALPHAVDLGIAMQITNICRDVAEDASNGRCYLPADRLAAVGVTQDDVIAGTANPATVFAVIEDLLRLAERYYASADVGMHWIPVRARLAILVAARLYRAIGLRILRRGQAAVRSRTIVGPLAKIGWVGAATAAWASTLMAGLPEQPHPVELHLALKGLPGASAS